MHVVVNISFLPEKKKYIIASLLCIFDPSVYQHHGLLNESICRCLVYINIIWFCSNWLAMRNSCYNPFTNGLLNKSICMCLVYINIIWFCSNWLAMRNSCYIPFIYGLLNESICRCLVLNALLQLFKETKSATMKIFRKIFFSF